MYRELGRVNILRDIPGTEWSLVEEQSQEGKPCIMDCEGLHVMNIPPMLIASIPDPKEQDSVLLELIAQHKNVADFSYDRGRVAGREEVGKTIRGVLGIDRIAEALEEIAGRN